MFVQRRFVFALSCMILLRKGAIQMLLHKRPKETMEAHVSAKEWLIQTIIPRIRHAILTLCPPVERPEIVNTFLRELFAQSRACFQESGMFPPGSFVHDQFLLSLLSFMVGSISVLSIVSNVVHWRWLLATLLLSIAVLLIQDTYMNHFRHSLHYGLYWNWYAQGGIGLVCMISAGLQVRRIYRPRRPPRVNISNRRKVASALGAFVASLSLPLSLRSMSESNKSTSRNLLLMAVLAFQVGLYFFGLALRALIIADSPVGEIIFQISLAPFKGSRQILRKVEDFGKVVLRKLWSLVIYLIDYILLPIYYEVDSILRLASEQVWNQVLHPFGAAVFRAMSSFNEILQPFVRRVIEVLRNIVNSIRPMCTFIISLLSQVTKWAVESMIAIANHMIVSFRTVVTFICSMAQSFALWMKHTIWWMSTSVVSLLSQGTQWAWELTVAFANHVIEILRPVIAFICSTAHSFALWMKRTILQRCVNAAIFIRDKLLSAVVFMLDKSYLCFGMARDFVYRVWNMLSNNVIEPFVRTAKKEAQQLLTFIGTLASRVAADIVSSARQVWRSILAPSLCRIMPWCDTLCKMVITALSPFFKKYWQLISAGLAFNGSYHYFFAAILSDFSIIDRAKYLLGAWTLAVIGYIVARSVLLSSGTLVSQRLTVEDSALKFMDLRICHALFRICSSGWHLMSKSLELSLKSADFVVRKTCSGVWWILGTLFQVILKPLLTLLFRIARSIWDSPYMSILAAAGALSIGYFVHRSQVTWEVQMFTVNASHMDFVQKAALRVLDCISHGMSLATHFVGSIFHNVYAPVVNADASSPDVAFFCWLFASAATKGRTRVRLKTFAVPVVVFYLSGVARSSIFKAVCFSLALWFCLSLLVDRYEEQSRERTRETLDEFQRQSSQLGLTRRSRTQGTPYSNLSPSTSDEDSPCVICLDVLDGRNEMLLPCGHTFHDQCIRQWLETSPIQRCPTCRRATGGWDRVLEVAF
jgi:hypothetical protein